jgi:hypothetical protein
MIIKLTNLAKNYEGPILINPRHIMSVFTQTKTLEDKVVETVTVVYSVTKEGWEVKESVEDIYDLIKEAKSYD